MVASPFDFKIFSKNIKIIPKRFLGIDVGTSSIKIVEVSGAGERKKLENYGELKAEVLFEKQFRTSEKSTLIVYTRDIARGILAILDEAKIQIRDAAFSIPDFSSFFTWYELPPMTEEELNSAIQYEARQQIPVPLSEVTLGWQIIGGRPSDKQKSDTAIKVLLVAVPNEVIHRYQEIAGYCQLNLRSLEAEVFSLSRALVKEGQETVSLIDIGARSTTISVIDNGIIKRSHSFDIAGNELTATLANGLGVDYKEAENLKKKYGLIPPKDLPSSPAQLKEEKIPPNIREMLIPLVDLIITETEKISSNFLRSENKEVRRFVLAGGAAAIPGLIDYFSSKLQKPTETANPFSDLLYPPILEKTLKEMGPSYAVAVGAALKGLE